MDLVKQLIVYCKRSGVQTYIRVFPLHLRMVGLGERLPLENLLNILKDMESITFYCIPWRTNGSRKTINCLLQKELSSNLYKGFPLHLSMVGFGEPSPWSIC